MGLLLLLNIFWCFVTVFFILIICVNIGSALSFLMIFVFIIILQKKEKRNHQTDSHNFDSMLNVEFFDAIFSLFKVEFFFLVIFHVYFSVNRCLSDKILHLRRQLKDVSKHCSI